MSRRMSMGSQAWSRGTLCRELLRRGPDLTQVRRRRTHRARIIVHVFVCGRWETGNSSCAFPDVFACVCSFACLCPCAHLCETHCIFVRLPVSVYARLCHSAGMRNRSHVSARACALVRACFRRSACVHKCPDVRAHARVHIAVRACRCWYVSLPSSSPASVKMSMPESRRDKQCV